MSVEDEERERKREERRRRNEANPLESVVWLTEEQKRDFRAAMEEQGVEACSEEWRRRAKDFVDRLWRQHPSWAQPPRGGRGHFEPSPTPDLGRRLAVWRETRVGPCERLRRWSRQPPRSAGSTR